MSVLTNEILAFATSRRSPRGDDGCKFSLFDDSLFEEEDIPYEMVFVDEPEENSEGTNEVLVSFPFLAVGVDRQGEVGLSKRRPGREVREVDE